VLVQEPGHNFGMVHSSAMRCTLNGQPVPLAWPSQMGSECKHIEYGNPFDPMGGGDCFHMNGVQKAYQDWLSGCNVVKATSSGTFTLYPLESACDGPQLLQIPFPQPRTFGNAGKLASYYLELRAPLGRDSKAPPGVLVIVANEVREARLAGNNNWLLDMTPETMKLGDEALPVGKPFADGLPGGPKFTVVSVDATKAVIQVELQGQAADPGKVGKGMCGDATDFQPDAPVKCVAPPTPAAPPPKTPDGGVTPTIPADAGAVTASDGPPVAPVPRDAAAPSTGVRRDAATTGTDPPDEPDPATHLQSSGGCAVGGPGAAPPALLLLIGAALFRRRRR
jgi:MYXO-CTERM domain-containing protein